MRMREQEWSRWLLEQSTCSLSFLLAALWREDRVLLGGGTLWAWLLCMATCGGQCRWDLLYGPKPSSVFILKLTWTSFHLPTEHLGLSYPDLCFPSESVIAFVKFR